MSQVLKALGVLVLHHLADFGTDWRIENALQIMAWYVDIQVQLLLILISVVSILLVYSTLFVTLC